MGKTWVWTVLAVVAFEAMGCKGSATSASDAGTPSSAEKQSGASTGGTGSDGRIAWTVVESTDRGQLLTMPGCNDCNTEQTTGKFVQLRIQLVNSGDKEEEIGNPPLVDNKGREFKPVRDYRYYVPGSVEGNKALGNQRVRPGIPGEGWIVYEVPADAEGLALRVRRRAGVGKDVLIGIGVPKKQDAQRVAERRPSATPPTQQPKANGGFADQIQNRPELVIPSEAIRRGNWLSRIAALTTRGFGEAACGKDYKVEGKDEFERRDSKAKADAACKSELDAAIGFLKKCPAIGIIQVEVGQYDFGRKVFPVDFQRGRAVTKVTNDQRIFFDDSVLLSFPLVGGAERKGGGGVDLCEVDPAQAEDVYSQARLLVLVQDEATAKAARATMPSTLQIAYLLDGGTSKGGFACGGQFQKAQATGRVLAWQMPPSFGWANVTAWEPDGDCAAARQFFGVRPEDK